MKMLMMKLPYMIMMMPTLIIVIPMNIYKKNPMFQGMILLSMSILTSINLNLMNNSSFYSFIVYLTIVGGLMIMFLYLNSFALNNKMLMNPKLMYWMLVKLMLMMMLMFLIIYKMNMFNMMQMFNKMMNDTNSMMNMTFNSYNFMFKMNKIFSSYMTLSLFSIIYLLISLMYSMKICNKSLSSMRMTKN